MNHPLLRLAACACLASFFFAASPASAAAEASPIRRFALVAGANDGGLDRTRLRYAGSDAMAVARVLEELGGVAPADRLLLVDPDRAELQGAFAELARRLEAARTSRERLEVFVYYSGHSDEEGLLLGGERFGYEELRHALAMLPADVRVAILDSCASGALTRRKGGVRRPPFLVDAASQVKGHAFLTSASADEAAQESDRIGASFFTHYLVSGLRGAADASRDGRVTLNEAYQFAFAETLARTSKTNAGAQHPAYEMQLVGTGDLVMTDLRSTSAGLVVDEAIGGRIFVRDESGALVVELRKAHAAPPVELGLAPGAYVITVEDRGRLSEGRIALAEGARKRLGTAQLVPIEGEAGRLRGVDSGEEVEWVEAPFVVGLIPGSSTLPSGADEDRVITRFGLNLLGGRTGRLDGTVLGLGINWYTDRADGAMAAIGANLVEGDARCAQIAVAFNHAEGRIDGLQMAVGFNASGAGGSAVQSATGANVAGGSLVGGQIATGLNWTSGRLSGVQAAVGVNLVAGQADEESGGADEVVMDGVQLAAGTNWAHGAIDGVQATAGVNVAGGGDSSGAQIAAGVNVAGGTIEGAQIAAGVNTAGRIEGAQIGVINVGGSADGLQLGVINVAVGEVDGAQIGVLNYADAVDAPIGVLSIVRRGRFRAALWADEVNAGNLGAKLGSEHVYTLLTVGAAGRSTREGELRWTTGIGLGTHLPVGARALSFVDIDLLARNVQYGSSWERNEGFHFIGSLRIAGGWELLPRLALVAGPTLNVQRTNPRGAARGGFGVFGRSAELHASEHSVVRLWPGFFAGLEI